MRHPKKALLALLLLPVTVLLLAFSSPTAHTRPHTWHPGTPNYDLMIKVKGLADTTVLLAYYYGDKQYIKDTFDVNSKGEIHITGEDTLGGGVYMIVMPDKNYFEFIAGEPNFTLETELGSLVKSMKVKGSVENTLFFEYLRFIEDKKKSADVWRSVKSRCDAQPDSCKKADEILGELDKEVVAYKTKFIESHSGSFVSKLLKAGESPAIVEAPATITDSTARANWRFYHYKSHFFDNIDFSDDRMLRTPVFHQKLKEYIDKLTAQDPDSVIKTAKEIITRAESNREVFKYCTIYITNFYAKSQLMCFDKVYWWMVDNYYLKDRAWWLDTAQLGKMKERHTKMRYNLCGNPAVNLVLEDTAGTMQSIGQIKSRYTVIYFWDYDCGHCKKVTPKMVEFYNDWIRKGVTVYAVCTRDDKLKWKQYIKENHMEKMINVMDPQNKTNFRIFYDVYSTPVIYLLDEKKVIKGKRFEVEGLKDFLKKMEEIRLQE